MQQKTWFTAKITCGPAPQPLNEDGEYHHNNCNTPIGVGAIPMTYLTLADRVNHYQSARILQDHPRYFIKNQ